MRPAAEVPAQKKNGAAPAPLAETLDWHAACEVDVLLAGQHLARPLDFQALEMALASASHPRDEALGLDDRSVSPGVQCMIGLVSARNSFAESQYLLRGLAKVKVSASQVERTAEMLGQRIAQHEQNQTELESPPAPTLYLGMDGTGVPMRTAEIAGRAGKQPDGRSKTRDMKIVSVWSAEGRNQKGHAVVDPDSVTRSAAIESAHAPDSARLLSAFARRVEREALRRGFDQAPGQVVIGDGARWIWNLCTELFPKAIQIVDIYHAKEKLWELGKLLYGNGSDLARRWSEDRIRQLKDGDIEKLIQVLQSESSRHESVDSVIGYYQHNKERMRYATFRDQGLCISSAVVEAGCKNAIGTRLKRGGMHWTVKGANEIAALRCYVKSNRHDDFG